MVNNLLVVSSLLFLIGVAGVLIRRNIFVVFMSIELMLNAGNLAFVNFSKDLGLVEGNSIAMIVMAVAAAEAAFGLALVMLVYKQKNSLDIDIFKILRG
jgi:NADH-quinone oxidoreductase subunit K